jgi:O-antigen/teichoic acid export membrane protein
MSAQGPTPLAVQQREGTSLRADFSWTFLGNAVYTGGQLVTLMLLAKLTRPELVGQYALGLAIAVPVITLASLQLRLALVSDIHERTHFGHYLSLRLLTTGLALVIIFATTQILGYSWQLSTVVVMVGIAQAIEAISDVFYGRMQLHDRMDMICKSMIARSVLSTLGLPVGVYLSGDLLWGIAGIVVARGIVLFGYDIRRTHELAEQSDWFSRNDALKPRWDSKVQRQLIWFNFPLGIATVLVSLNFTIPRYFVEHALGERALGIFSAIACMLAAGSMAAVSLGQSAFSRLAKAYGTGNLVQFRSLVAKLLTLGAAMGVCGLIVAKVAGREVLAMLFGPEYAERADLLPWMMAVGCVVYVAQFLGYGMTAARCYRPQVVLFTLTNLAVAAHCYLLIPRLGLLGAILAMLIATIVQLVGSIVILLRNMRKYAPVRVQTVEAVPRNVFVRA